MEFRSTGPNWSALLQTTLSPKIADRSGIVPKPRYSLIYGMTDPVARFVHGSFYNFEASVIRRARKCTKLRVLYLKVCGGKVSRFDRYERVVNC